MPRLASIVILGAALLALTSCGKPAYEAAALEDCVRLRWAVHDYAHTLRGPIQAEFQKRKEKLPPESRKIRELQKTRLWKARQKKMLHLNEVRSDLQNDLRDWALATHQPIIDDTYNGWSAAVILKRDMPWKQQESIRELHDQFVAEDANLDSILRLVGRCPIEES